MKGRAEYYFLLALMLVFVAAIVGTLEFPTRAALFPLLICGIGICLAALRLLPLLRTRAVPAKGETGKGESDRTLSFIIAGWIIAFFAAALILGFQWGLPIISLLFMIFIGKQRPILSVAVSVAMWLFLFSVFPIMRIQLYEGALWRWIGLG